MTVDLDVMSIKDMQTVLKAIERNASDKESIPDEDYEEIKDRVYGLIAILEHLNKQP